MHVVKPYNPKNKYTFYRYFNCISKHVANKNCYQQYKLLCLNKQPQDHWNIGKCQFSYTLKRIREYHKKD